MLDDISVSPYLKSLCYACALTNCETEPKIISRQNTHMLRLGSTKNKFFHLPHGKVNLSWQFHPLGRFYLLMVLAIGLTSYEK